MKLLHMKYAVEISETNSINKAAENLYVGQSALSRAIKELESSLGVTLFERSPKGMFLTPDGEVFVRYAKTILKQVDDVETMFSGNHSGKKRFSVSVPRASYVSEAFARFSRSIGENEKAELFYKETNSIRAIKNILQEDYKLGIIRYAESYDRYYRDMMEEKELVYDLITRFRYVLVFSKDSPLAKKENLSSKDLGRYMEIAHADPYVPSLPFAEVRKEELTDSCTRRIYVFERGSQFELLSQNTDTFMWVSPIPESLLKRYGLVQRSCPENRKIYRDVLTYRRDYTLTELDRLFIDQLIKTRAEVLGEEKTE